MNICFLFFSRTGPIKNILFLNNGSVRGSFEIDILGQRDFPTSSDDLIFQVKVLVGDTLETHLRPYILHRSGAQKGKRTTGLLNS